ncbi:MAG: flagellar biosynthesis anti-sigma factor FlgM [Pseudomonadota bacterium]
MKIGNPADKPPPAAVTNGHASANGVAHAAAARSGAVKKTDAADASATIELSSTAATLLTSGATAEFDAEKVARIAKAIDDGTFKVNPEAIADKLISNAAELLGKVQT